MYLRRYNKDNHQSFNNETFHNTLSKPTKRVDSLNDFKTKKVRLKGRFYIKHLQKSSERSLEIINF